MIDPLKILVATPSYNGQVDTGYAAGLAACASAHLFGTMTYLNSCSHVQHARNSIVARFMQSPFDWLIFIDADITFTVFDFKMLCDFPTDSGGYELNPNFENAVTRDDAGHPLISCAEYSKKQDNGEHAKLGLGFCKISKQVFLKLDALNHEDGSARVDQYMSDGFLTANYFPSGAMDGRFMMEDYGFFTMCRLAGIVPRIEQRTRLIHTGRKQYHYDPPLFESGPA
jgi:hypothetical protein